MPETSIKLLEKVQGQCLRAIMGTSAHASSDAIKVVANVMPVWLRIDELCIREFVHSYYIQVCCCESTDLATVSIRTAQQIHSNILHKVYIERFSRSFGRQQG